MKPHKPVKILLNFTSLHDLINAIDNMAVFDRLMSELGRSEFMEYEEEDAALNAIGKPWENNLQLLPDVEQHRQYSPNPEI